jgi:dihydroflavonol-4-reductase
MKIFVTGATGFIGTQTVKRLASAGHQICCLVRSVSQSEQFKRLGLESVPGDLTDKDSLLRGMKGCDAVINLAAAYQFWLPDTRVYREVNIEGTRNVMEATLEAAVSKVVHVSSVVIYGKPEASPFTEDSEVGLVRFSEYAQTKYEGDLIAWEFHEKMNLPLVVVYPGAVLGANDPKASGDYIRDLVQHRMPATIFSESPFSWVHVRDVAEGIARAVEAEANIGEKYLLVGETLTFGELNQMINEISGVPLPKLSLPGPVAAANAYLLTTLANIIKKPPLWGLATDQVRTMREGAAADGSKAARELGLTYTPIRTALEEAIASLHE